VSIRELVQALASALDGGPAVLVGVSPAQARGLELPADTALVLPTSGSTGTPKLVALGAAAIRASAAASAERLGGRGHWLLALPTDHIAGLNVVCRALLAGGPPTVMAPGPFTAEGFAAAAARLPPGPRFASLVPTQLRRLIGGAGDGIGGAADGIGVLRRFDAVLVGGAALDAGLRRRAEAAGVRVVATYGAAETGGGCVYDGRPLGGVRVTLAAGGRIEVAGPTLATGYARQPGGAAGTGFFERDQARWFATSDLGRWAPDGRLEVIGRVDDAITSGGLTVSPQAVEAVLRGLPGVVDALVVGLEEPTWGQVVTALVVPDAAGPPSLGGLRRAVGRALDQAHAPRRLALVEALPTLAPGKPDRAAAAALAARLDASGQLERSEARRG
jgi:O-succinylbenzoic acid--CoA ligase